MNKIEMGKKYKTRGGDNVTILTTNANVDGYSVVALIRENDNDLLLTFKEDGSHYQSSSNSSFDLIEVKTVRVVTWLRKDSSGVYADCVSSIHVPDLNIYKKNLESSNGFISWVSDVTIEY